MAMCTLPTMKANARAVRAARPAPARAQAVRRAAAKAPAARRAAAIVPRANKSDISATAEEVLDKASKAWEEVEEKPAAIALATSSIIVPWATSSVVDAIEKLPIFSGLFELVGIGYTGYFVYRYLLFKPDREELKEIVDEFVKKIFE